MQSRVIEGTGSSRPVYETPTPEVTLRLIDLQT